MEPYKVIVPPTELRKLKAWGEGMKWAGTLDAFLVALKTISYRLSCEPTDWGEAKYSLPDLGLDVRSGAFRMLNVWYGVNEGKRLVVVKVFHLLRDQPPPRVPPDAG